MTSTIEMLNDPIDTPCGAASHPELVVINPATGAEVGRLMQSLPVDVPEIVSIACDGRRTTRLLPRRRRAEILDRAAALMRERSDQFSEMIVAEAGKTLRQARKEVLHEHTENIL